MTNNNLDEPTNQKKFTLNRTTVLIGVGIAVAVVLIISLAYGLMSLLASNDGATSEAAQVEATGQTPTLADAVATNTPGVTNTPTLEPPTPTLISPTATPALLSLTSTNTQSLPPEVQAYSAEAGKKVQTLARSLVRLGALMRNADLNDSNWTTTFAIHVGLIQFTHESLSKLTPPAEMVEIHQALLEAAGDCHEATDLLVSGIDNQRVEDLNAGAVLMESCAEKLRQATEALSASLQPPE